MVDYFFGTIYMNIAINKKLLELDTYQLKLHMEQCKKELCIKKSIRNAITISYGFITKRIITSLTFLTMGFMGVNFII